MGILCCAAPLDCPVAIAPSPQLEQPKMSLREQDYPWLRAAGLNPNSQNTIMLAYEHKKKNHCFCFVIKPANQSMCPQLKSNPILQSSGRHSIYWATPARATERLYVLRFVLSLKAAVKAEQKKWGPRKPERGSLSFCAVSRDPL